MGTYNLNVRSLYPRGPSLTTLTPSSNLIIMFYHIPSMRKNDKN